MIGEFAVVELPDDLMEANAAAQLAVMRTAPPSLNDMIATVLIAAEPLIAVRVRAEALERRANAPAAASSETDVMRGRLRSRAASSGIVGEGPEMVDAFERAIRAEAVAERDAIIEVIQQYLPEALPFNTLPEIVGGIARQRDFQHELKDHLAEVARRLTDERDAAVAEAVAGERQRALTVIDAAIQGEMDLHQCSFDELPEANTRFVQGLRRAHALVAAGSVPVATPQRPEIVVLCGSTRFKDAFREAAKAEALAGRIVLTVSDLDPRPEARHVNVPIDAETKARLDELHRRKIDLADQVLVLNVGGYIGESTRSEIEYATALGKPISYLEAGPRLQSGRVGFGKGSYQGAAFPVLAGHPEPWFRETPESLALLEAERAEVAAVEARAVQPPTCEHGRTTKHVYGSPDESDYGLCPGPAEQPEER